MSILGLVAAVIVLAVIYMTSSSIKLNKEPNYLLIGIALIAALLFTIFFISFCVYIFMYRPFHFNNLSKGTAEKWNEDRKLLWWTTFFSIMSALGFLMSSIVLWILVKYYIDAAKMVVGMSCFVGVILSCFALLQLGKA